MNFEALHEAVERLRAGRVVAFPTETVYGLGADALSPAAIAEVYRLKGRPQHNPLIVHVSGPEMARPLVHEWTEQADLLSRALWPGPLTLVLAKSSRVPDSVTAGGPTVALRSPNHPLAMALIMLFDGPLVGPSANASGGVSPTRAEHVRSAFGDDEVLTLDGGACAVGIESTVLMLDPRQGPPRILRPGVIGPDAIGEVLGIRVESGSPAASKGQPLASPGLLASHYAPRTRAVLADPNDIEDLLEDASEDGRRAVLLSHQLAAMVSDEHELVRMPASAGEYAAAIYDALRHADDLGADVIIITRPPDDAELAADRAIWRAVHDRLARATAVRD